MTAAHNDRLIKNLHKDEIRDRILKGELKKQDTDCSNIFDFMQLLQNKNKSISTKQFQPITIEDWKSVVKQAKRKSDKFISRMT